MLILGASSPLIQLLGQRNVDLTRDQLDRPIRSEKVCDRHLPQISRIQIRANAHRGYANAFGTDFQLKWIFLYWKISKNKILSNLQTHPWSFYCRAWPFPGTPTHSRCIGRWCTLQWLDLRGATGIKLQKSFKFKWKLGETKSPTHRQWILPNQRTTHSQNVGRVELLEHGRSLTSIYHKEQLIVPGRSENFALIKSLIISIVAAQIGLLSQTFAFATFAQWHPPTPGSWPLRCPGTWGIHRRRARSDKSTHCCRHPWAASLSEACPPASCPSTDAQSSPQSPRSPGSPPRHHRHRHWCAGRRCWRRFPDVDSAGCRPYRRPPSEWSGCRECPAAWRTDRWTGRSRHAGSWTRIGKYPPGPPNCSCGREHVEQSGRVAARKGLISME